MNKLFLILIFLAPVFCYGQEKSVSPVFSLQSNASLKRTTLRVFVIPTVGVQTSKYEIAVGPTIRSAQYAEVDEDHPLFTGIQGVYRRFITKENRKLRFFSEYNIRYQELEEEWTSNYWNDIRKEYINFEVESEEVIFDNSLGIGLQWNFYRRIYLNANLNVGYYFSDQDYDDEDELFPMILAKDYRPYSTSGMIYSFYFGFSYRLGDILPYLKNHSIFN